ncbi:MAG: SocA family protein [Candidatus Magnetoovum sp. WYHC-5]|nr:SocA family protein [Candidatus Magnetoovum sp. WYHC-5]
MGNCKEKLKNLVSGLLSKTGSLPQVKLSKFVFFTEIEHFLSTGYPLSGCVITKGGDNPLIVDLQEVLDEGSGILWFREVMFMPVKYLAKGKKQYLYESIVSIELPERVERAIDTVLSRFGSKHCSELTDLIYSMPAWKRYSVNDELNIRELAESFEYVYFNSEVQEEVVKVG